MRLDESFVGKTAPNFKFFMGNPDHQKLSRTLAKLSTWFSFLSLSKTSQHFLPSQVRWFFETVGLESVTSNKYFVTITDYSYIHWKDWRQPIFYRCCHCKWIIETKDIHPTKAEPHRNQTCSTSTYFFRSHRSLWLIELLIDCCPIDPMKTILL